MFRRPRRHPAAQGPGPGPAHAARRGAAVRGLADAGGAANADIRGGTRRRVACLRRTALLRQLRTYRQRAAFRGEEERRTRLAGLPDGVSVEPGRIEGRFSGAKDAVGRLFALAQALTHDYEQLEALVEAGAAAGGEGAGRQ